MTNNMYPVLDSGLAFFNHAGVSPLPADVAQAVHDYADQAARSGYFGSTWMDDMEDFRQVSADLIGARSPERNCVRAQHGDGRIGLCRCAQFARW